MMQREEKRDFSIVKNERTLQELSDSIRNSSIRIKGIQEEEREKGMKSAFKLIVDENFPTYGKS